MLIIKDLHVNVKEKSIIKNFNLHIKAGETHAIMGPNGSGKSTFSETIAGKENLTVTSGTILFKGFDLLALSAEKRAGEGIFVAFQYPVEIQGISNNFFLHTAINSIRTYRKQPTLDRFEFADLINSKSSLLDISYEMINRSVNVGFSGGEKKRNDILQMMILEPTLCILDETDSGLDIDALKIISHGVNTLKNKERAFIIITHYQRILNYITPDYIHILYDGNIIKSGDFSLVKLIEKNGYDWIK